MVAASGTIATGSADTLAFTVQDCDTYVFGCTDSLAFNYDSLANSDNGLCLLRMYRRSLFEFDASATDDDGSCLTMIVCLYGYFALNLDSLANVEDNSM